MGSRLPEKPIVIDLFCGLGGWSDGFLAEGYECIGFDIERHDYGTGGYPGQLVLQDALTLHGSQFKDAACIVASPPCQEFSYMAMPWTRAKQIAAALRGQGEFPDGYRGSRTIEQLTALFDACFRIQREASEAAGRHIPMVVENVKGAQPWVGRAPWNYGSFYLWGDVPALMPFTARGFMKAGHPERSHRDGHVSTVHLTNRAEHAIKVPNMNFHDYEKTGKPGRSFQSAAVESMGTKTGGDWFGRGENCSPMRMREEDYQAWIGSDGTKQAGLSGPAWFDKGAASKSSRSHARKAASAQIAKIPFELSAHIARCFRPEPRYPSSRALQLPGQQNHAAASAINA